MERAEADAAQSEAGGRLGLRRRLPPRLLSRLASRLRGAARRLGSLVPPGFRPSRGPKHAEAERIAALFSPEWYVARHPEAAASGLAPLEHYLRVGLHRGWDPHPLFEGAWYLRRHPDVAAAGLTPILHYAARGFREGRDTHPLFDADWYRRSNPDLAWADGDPLAHYLASGFREGRSPHPLFDVAHHRATGPDLGDAEPLAHHLAQTGSGGGAPNPLFDGHWYLEQNPDIAAAGQSPLRHFVTSGAAEGRDPHPLFALGDYPPPPGAAPWGGLAHHLHATLPALAEAVAASGVFAAAWYASQAGAGGSEADIALHYLKHGAALGLSPHPLFDAAWYVARYPDLAAEAPFLHYATCGAGEGRWPGPLVQPDWFAAHRGHPEDDALSPLAFFLRHGVGEARTATPHFDPDWYRERHPEVAASGLDPLLHFALAGLDAGLRPNAVFDPAWYAARHAALMRPELPAFGHFTAIGSECGLDPGPFFDAAFYAKAYPDVVDDGSEPVAHYLESGRAEGRLPYRRGDTQKIAVVLHLCRLDLLAQVKANLKSITGPFDLYVTHSAPVDAPLAKQLRRLSPRTELVPVPDSGSDAVPFLTALRHMARRGERYLCVCKIHTESGGAEPEIWRYLLLGAVLGDRPLVSDIVRGFAQDPSLALVGARHLYSDGETSDAGDLEAVARLCGDLYPGAGRPARWGFIAGAMFWCRPELFHRLAEALDADEPGSHGGGWIAPGVERMFGLVPALEGRRVGLIGLTPRGRPDWDHLMEDAGRWTAEEPLDRRLVRLAEIVRPNLSAGGEGQRHIARRWAPPPDARPGVRLVGPLRAINGLGTSARGYLRALEATGWRVAARDWGLGFDHVTSMPLDLPADADEPIQVTHLNLDLIAALPNLFPAEVEPLLERSRYHVLVPYFELVSLQPEWIDVLARFDEVWCASTFLERALNAASPIPTRIVRPTILPEIAEAGRFGREHFGLPGDAFAFGYFADAASVLGRKNPMALLEAYLAEFTEGDGTCCFLKVHYGRAGDAALARMAAMARGRRDVILSDAIYSGPEIEALVGLLDCYVSPHRSEGLGLTIVEAMNAGVPVIATGYGGSIDMLDPAASLPVSHRLVEVGPGNHPYPASYVWADPEPAALRAAMRSLAGDRGRARALGAAGRAHVERLFGVGTTGPAARAALDDVWRRATAAAPDGGT